MCGIAAYFSFGKQPKSVIRRMTDIISHRGPDDEGYVFFESINAVPGIYGGRDTPEQCYNADFAYCPKRPLNEDNDGFYFGFGHRRLAIVDVSPAGHQPMSTDNGECWIVYNGEVYNHIELREELEDKGFRFKGHSDTEVLLAAYQYWGKDFLSKLNGMFAFIIYDLKKQSFFIARDRFGIKPLYYWVSSAGIGFASEIKQFTVLPGWQPVMNSQRAYDFLNWGASDHTPETFFAGVFQLRGGECIELSASDLTQGKRPSAGTRLTTKRWYKLEPREFTGDRQMAVNEFKDLFYDSVKLRLRADVAVGSCLSGGLDSSSIVTVANELLKDSAVTFSQKTFSACSDIERFDEKKYVDIVVKQTGVNAHYVYPALKNLFEENEKIIWHQDEPYNTTSAYAQWNVFKLAKENNVTVMLDGQGADEQLAGYHRFFGSRFTTLFKELKWVSLVNEILATKRLHGYSEKLAIMQVAGQLMPGSFRTYLLRRYGMSSTKSNWINLDLIKASPVDPMVDLGAKTDTIENRSYWELTSTNLQKLLHWEDRSSMAQSIEARLPFLDYRLVEMVLGLPDDLKISRGITKVVLRDALTGTLPDQIRDRTDKLGFVTPEQVWVCDMEPEQFKSRIKYIVEKYCNIFNQNAIQISSEIIDGKRKYSSLPWRIISFGTWMEKFNVQVQ